MKEHLEKQGFRKKVVHIYNFIDVEKITPKIEMNEGYILYSGRMSEEKGIFTLLKAAIETQISLKIAGDGPLKESAMEYIKGKSCRVEFLGHLAGNDLKEIYEKAAIVIVPSEWYENNPMVIIEAFCYGKPVIGSKIGGIPELIGNNERGMLFPCGNSEILGKCMVEIMTNKELSINIGSNARKFAEKAFTKQRYYSSLMKMYELAVKNNNL